MLVGEGVWGPHIVPGIESRLAEATTCKANVPTIFLVPIFDKNTYYASDIFENKKNEYTTHFKLFTDS